MTESRSDLLRSNSYSFCRALITPPPPSQMISQFFTCAHPRITEHGPKWSQSRLPFLSKTFSGSSGPGSCETYFEVLSQTLKMHMHDTTFPSLEGFIVDPEAVAEGSEGKGVVCVVGKGGFESVSTGKRWEEKFIYRLSGFDDEGKIGHWEIWADPLSAWDAVCPD